MTRITSLLAVLIISGSVLAQDKNEFKPHGKPVVKVFANWHKGMGKDSELADNIFSDDTGFEIKRAVIGYEYNFAPKISAKVVLDTDNPNDKLTETAYLRNAYLKYSHDLGQLYFGIIGMKQFKTQENNWGYRYLYKSSMDHYKFNNSVDAGMHIKVKAMSWLSADLTISNGEGAKSQQDTEGKYRYGVGIEMTPLEKITFRTYYDFFQAPQETGTEIAKDQQMLALFLGYTGESFRLGGELNFLTNYKFTDHDDRNLYSIYSTYIFNDKLQMFSRYDKLDADVAGESEYVALGGVQYHVVKGVKIAPNYRYLHQGSDDSEQGHYVFLNVEFKF